MMKINNDLFGFGLTSRRSENDNIEGKAIASITESLLYEWNNIPALIKYI